MNEKAEAIKFKTRILRKQDFLPRYIVVNPKHFSASGKAFVAKVMLNDVGPFERNVKPWGRESDLFFFNLTEPQCQKAGLNTNDEVLVTMMQVR